jgi:hypothetical protein
MLNNMQIAAKVWALHQKKYNDTKIAKELHIHRNVVANILKYTLPNMYEDAQSIEYKLLDKEKKISIYKNISKKYSNDVKILETKLSNYTDAYISTLPYKRYFYKALIAATFVGFLNGGFVEKKMMNSFGYFVTINDVFPNNGR